MSAKDKIKIAIEKPKVRVYKQDSDYYRHSLKITSSDYGDYVQKFKIEYFECKGGGASPEMHIDCIPRLIQLLQKAYDDSGWEQDED